MIMESKSLLDAGDGYTEDHRGTKETEPGGSEPIQQGLRRSGHRGSETQYLYQQSSVRPRLSSPERGSRTVNTAQTNTIFFPHRNRPRCALLSHLHNVLISNKSFYFLLITTCENRPSVLRVNICQTTSKSECVDSKMNYSQTPTERPAFIIK